MAIEKYLKNTGRPAKRIPGTNKAILATTTVHGPNQSRCMRCQGMCRSTNSAAGKPVMKCTSCGFTFTMKPM